jgi:hypothetical protein
MQATHFSFLIKERLRLMIYADVYGSQKPKIKPRNSFIFKGLTRFSMSETRGIRTRDNLIKSQVLYQLS